MKIVYTVKLPSNCYRRYFPNVMGIAMTRNTSRQLITLLLTGLILKFASIANER